jgi:hypothetical protein
MGVNNDSQQKRIRLKTHFLLTHHATDLQQHEGREHSQRDLAQLAAQLAGVEGGGVMVWFDGTRRFNYY